MAEFDVGRLVGIHDVMAASHPKLQRGQVWCLSCGATQRVDAAQCLRHGWPTCCGATMTLDAPDVRGRSGRQATSLPAAGETPAPRSRPRAEP